MAARLIRWATLRRSLLLLLLVRLALGVTYSLINPPWEAYDEDGHFAYARYIARYHKLLQPGDPEAEAVWEKFQPPLYYLLLAPALMPFDLGETFQTPERYPYAPNGNAGANYNIQASTLTSTIWAMYLARLVSVLISTVSVAIVYRLAQRVWPRRPTLAFTATAVYALWPQFLYVGSMVTNDALATALAAASTYAAVVVAQEGLRVRRVLGLSFCIGAALLTKLNGLALIPLALGAVILGSRVTRSRRHILWALVVLPAAIAAALVGLSLLDFVTTQVFQPKTLFEFIDLAQPSLEAPDSVLQFVGAALHYGARTFVASLGWGNLEIWGWAYWVAGLGALGAGLGLIRLAAQRVRSTPRAIIGLLGLHFISLVGLSLALALSQNTVHLIPGRYLLPALPTVAIWLTAGWEALLSSAWRRWAWRGASVGLSLLGWAIPLWIIAPTYAFPPPLTAPPPNPTSIRFGDSIELVGYAISPLTAGARSPLTLCWQTHAPLTDNYSVLLEVVGSDGQGYERLQTYPGHGNYATTLWEPGRAFCDEYTLSIGADIPAPSTADLRVALLTTTDTNGPRLPLQSTTEMYATFPVKVAAGPRAPLPTVAHAADVRFSDVFRLHGYEIVTAPNDAQRRVTVILLWEALQTPSTDYTVFAHLRDTPTTLYAQADSAPQAGRYPTSLWTTGEWVRDSHTFILSDSTPPALDLYVGWVDAGGNRLPALGTTGQAVANDEVLLERGLVFRFPVPPHYTDFFYLPLVLMAESPPLPAPALAPYP